MDTLSLEIIFEISLHLDGCSTFRFLHVNKTFLINVFYDSVLWKKKLEKDFPKLTVDDNVYNPAAAYLNLEVGDLMLVPLYFDKSAWNDDTGLDQKNVTYVTTLCLDPDMLYDDLTVMIEDNLEIYGFKHSKSLRVVYYDKDSKMFMNTSNMLGYGKIPLTDYPEDHEEYVRRGRKGRKKSGEKYKMKLVPLNKVWDNVAKIVVRNSV